MSRIFITLALALALTGCQRAGRYPAPNAKAPKEKAEVKAVWGWAFPDRPPRDLPIRFVADDQLEWPTLPAFWNMVPHPMAGLRTIHVNQSPLSILTAFALLDSFESIAIKVPLGLPDPTPLIPECNPPTFGKWRLGKKIFFDPVLTAGTNVHSCAECHQPRHGFTEADFISLEGTRNTLSLLNVAFNRSQFWDGRVRSLEEVLMPSLDDELEGGASRVKVLSMHRFGGVARKLNQDPYYREQFRLVFGIDRVTQDAVAKALATYLRTILSGDSLYDRAVVQGFKAALDDAAMKRLGSAVDGMTREQATERLIQGHAVYAGKGGCAVCHPIGLFTDGLYHNVLVEDSAESQAVSGKETGRFAVLPIGLKDPAMRGAYRTPTLRNLSATPPYFHNGTRKELSEAVDHFRRSLDKDAPLLAKPLRDLLAGAPVERPIVNPSLFTLDEAAALLLFLRSLDGQAVDPMVSNR